MENVLILGASRGLGRELAKVILRSGRSVTGCSRKEQLLLELHKEHAAFDYIVADFTKPEGQERVLELLRTHSFDRIFYVAGGGPYGPFSSVPWSAQEWGWTVTFAFAARVLQAINQSESPPQTIVIGSAVAESAADPGAAIYCAAKHALRGLYQTLRAERPTWDLRLYSPGYMDTDMIPKNAAVRNKGLHAPATVAEDLWRWTLTGEVGSHMMAPKHPEEKM